MRGRSLEVWEDVVLCVCTVAAQVVCAGKYESWVGLVVGWPAGLIAALPLLAIGHLINETIGLPPSWTRTEGGWGAYSLVALWPILIPWFVLLPVLMYAVAGSMWLMELSFDAIAWLWRALTRGGRE